MKNCYRCNRKAETEQFIVPLIETVCVYDENNEEISRSTTHRSKRIHLCTSCTKQLEIVMNNFMNKERHL